MLSLTKLGLTGVIRVSPPCQAARSIHPTPTSSSQRCVHLRAYISSEIFRTDASFHLQMREANEEVGLPLNDARIYPLTTFLPFLSKYGLIVHSHVVFVSDYSIIDDLRASEDEVDRIWEVPLDMFLRGEGLAEEGLSEKGSEDWLYEDERYNSSDIDWKVRFITLRRLEPRH